VDNVVSGFHSSEESNSKVFFVGNSSRDLSESHGSRLGSINVNSEDVSNFLSGNQIIGSHIGLKVNKVLSDLREVLDNVEESLFSICADGESIFDLLEPNLFFLVNLLAVGSISIKG